MENCLVIGTAEGVSDLREADYAPSDCIFPESDFGTILGRSRENSAPTEVPEENGNQYH
jgi:hypothetical protein